MTAPLTSRYTLAARATLLFSTVLGMCAQGVANQGVTNQVVTGDQDTSGVLDRPVFDQAAPQPGAPVSDPVTLQEQVRTEQLALESLPRPELQRLADEGSRGAQVALGADFAREATLLSFAPAAANDALADAARWYSTAASRGFPGAPSLDQVGIQFVPIRIQRDARP